MSDLGPNMAKTAQRLIEQFGSSVTHTVVTVGAYDPGTGSASVTARGTVYKALAAAIGRQYVNGKWVESGAARFTLAALSLKDGAPKAGDRIGQDGRTYVIEGVRPLYVGDTLVSYELIAGAA